MTIEVGQIYKHYLTKNKTIITYIDSDAVTIVQSNGKSYKVDDYIIDNWYEFIAEYPTWQEAVNSKEFRDD